MNYEQKYKEAIVKLRELFNSAEDNNETLDLWFNDFVNIFPELKEGEDEKFLRYLIDCCKSTIESDDKGLELSMDTTKRLFAWLKKQAEHANFRNKIQIGDKVTRNEDGVLVNLSQLNRVAKKDKKQGDTKETLCDKCRKEQPSHSCQDITELGRCALEKQSEQKPTMIQWKGNNLKEVIDFTGIYKDRFEKWFHNSWEEYEKYVHEHNNIFKIFNEDGSHIEIPVGAWIVKTPDGYNTASRYVFRQKSAWSEEDENIRLRLIDYLYGKSRLAKDREDGISWLKSLKDRVQPKKELSEEDKTIVDSLLDILYRIKKGKDPQATTRLIEQHINFIKSLKYRYTWKPSAFHLECIEDAIAIYEKRGINAIGLKEILEELKKLKG